MKAPRLCLRVCLSLAPKQPLQKGLKSERAAPVCGLIPLSMNLFILRLLGAHALNLQGLPKPFILCSEC